MDKEILELAARYGITDKNDLELFELGYLNGQNSMLDEVMEHIDKPITKKKGDENEETVHD